MALEHNQSLIELNLSSIEGLNRNTLGSQGVKSLARVLPINPIISSINVSGNFIGDSGMLYICEGIRNGNTSLKSLSVGLNEITHESL